MRHSTVARRSFYLTAAKNRTKGLRQRLYEAQRGYCYLCGRRMAPLDEVGVLNRATLDHITPLAMGGQKAGNNVAMAHLKCNMAKADREPTACEWLFGRINANIISSEAAPRRRRFVKPFEMHGR